MSQEEAAVEQPATAPPEQDSGQPTQLTYTADIYPGTSGSLPSELTDAVQELERFLGRPVLMLLHGYGSDPDAPQESLTHTVSEAFLGRRESLKPGEKVGLVIDSPGGQAKAAYLVATFLKRHCGGFSAIIPRYAKSAATLLTLGADEIHLGEFAELGPLDVQVFDPERETIRSALDEQQALERLFSFTMSSVDRAMLLLQPRSLKKVDTLLPHAIECAKNMVHPLLDKIDVVNYTHASRLLKVAEDYAIRLLLGNYPPDDARRIASHLVSHYPDHNFLIDRPEAESFGLRIAPQSADMNKILCKFSSGITAIGALEVRHEEDN